MKTAIIDVKDFTSKFGDFTAVNGVYFTVEKGKVFGFLGPNGAGKTSRWSSSRPIGTRTTPPEDAPIIPSPIWDR